MSLREKTEYWTNWLLQETDTKTYTSVAYEVFGRLWLCVERFDESNNHKYVILANLFGKEIYTNPSCIHSQMCESILQELNKEHDLFDTFKLVYALYRLECKKDLPKSKSIEFVKLVITLACRFEDDSKTFEAFKMLKGTYL